MRFLRIVALVVGVLAGLFVAGGLVLPEQIRVARSIQIDAPPEKVFPLVNDLEAFSRWSPWATADTKTKYMFSGPESGVGARMSWSSDNPSVGSGSQEIVRSLPPKRVALVLDFDEHGSARASFHLEPVKAGTKVTWSFGYETGYDLVGRYLGLLMEGLVGKKYEEGLQRLKRLVEKGQV